MLFRLENPLALWAFCLVLLLIVRFAWKAKRLPDSFSLRRAIIASLAFSFCILGLARPQGGDQVTNQVSQNASLYIAVDVSQSMLATDTPPSRMQFAVHFAQQLLEQISQVKVALYPFAIDGYLQMPLSSDIQAARDLLSAMGPSITSSQGSHLGNALKTLYQQIEKAERIARERGGEWIVPQVLLLSDGESHYPVEDSILYAFRKSRIPIFTVSIGTSTGNTILTENRFGGHELIKERDGKPVVTKAHPELMKRISDLSGGYAYPGHFDEIPNLASRLKQSLQVGKLSTTFRLQREFYPWLFLMAFLLFCLEFSFGRWEFALRTLLFLALSFPLRPALAEAPVENENHAILTYNEGVNALASKDLKKAAEAFEQSVLGSFDPEVRKRALFNLGNTYLQMNDPEQALQAYQQAYDTKTVESTFDKETNQKISDNIALASRIQEMMKQKSKDQKPGEGEGGEGKPGGAGSDPKGPKQFQGDPLSDSMKQKVYDLISNEERQTMQRLSEEQNKKNNIQVEKPW